jgi:hypothetical protein
MRSADEGRTPDQKVGQGEKSLTNRRRGAPLSRSLNEHASYLREIGGLQPHRFRYWLTEVADERREEKLVEGCQVEASAAERAKQGERTISMDELTGVQATERKYPDLPMQAGHVLRREFEYNRHGTLSWFINFDVVDFPGD